MSISIEKLNNESWFKISNFDSIRPFFISVVSDSNHWMFISSNGGLTAGRKNSQYALFPYYTDDKLTELAHTTGSKTIFQVSANGENHIWEPFSDRYSDRYSITRNLYKNRLGNKIKFEETNNDFGVTFSYEWNSSNIYGFVRTSILKNHSGEKRAIKVLDGLQNIMPYGVSPDLQTASSNLADAYKRSELDTNAGIGIYALSAIIVDKAEPSEALKANVAWTFGLDSPKYLLSSMQLESFRKFKEVAEEHDVKGEKGAYLLVSDISVENNSEKQWTIVANVNQDQSQVISLSEAISSGENLAEMIYSDVQAGSTKLMELVGAADGLQFTADRFRDARHYSNVLFNIMRGGIFDDSYTIEKKDFVEYLRNANKTVVANNAAFINSLDEIFDKFVLESKLAECDDADLQRLGKEYLPLKFSRRHGDPSRPWNKFSINTNSEIDGSKILDYEGNWRDIFQNWEALVHSYPEFVEGMIYKFLNATTFDGYNPYRVTKGGFDWETIEPDNPWSYIGYWGDHQIIYLLKFLEFYNTYKEGALEHLFNRENFVYANVPYRIKSFKHIAEDPKNTIDFDEDSDHAIHARVKKLGADGALLLAGRSDIHRVNFIEKILATVLAKVSNFIPEGGIWMNTQRPEWNDANNALVGNGVSMVTLYYLRRFLNFFEPILASSAIKNVEVSEELATMFSQISEVLSSNTNLLSGPINNADRKAITEGLGIAGSDYRDAIYENGFSGKKVSLSISEIKDFVSVARRFMEHSIKANKRTDNLYHAYNLMSMEENGVTISYLDEMLEGQVAALSSGYLDAKESLELLDALRKSALYRPDQNSYILYPNKNLPGFLVKNNIPEASVNKSELLKTLVNDGNVRIITKDVRGGFHFNGNFKNAGDVKEALAAMKDSKYAALVEKDTQLVLQIFEEVFNHKAFTGRSGTFFGYEGLGSIYWHMVSKLYLAVMEVGVRAPQDGAEKQDFHKLVSHFEEIGKGIGVHKTPELYGAFPTDPYSHTPQHRGAQQPGMTGQVKEDILARLGELGVNLEHGKLSFAPTILHKKEFLSVASEFNYVDVNHSAKKLQLSSGSLCFTICQIPVIYKIDNTDSMTVHFSDGKSDQFESHILSETLSEEVFRRSGSIERIEVSIQGSNLL